VLPTNPHRTCQVQIVFLLLLLRSLLLRALLLSTLLLGHGPITSSICSTSGGSSRLRLETIAAAAIRAANHAPSMRSRVRMTPRIVTRSTLRATSVRRASCSNLSRCKNWGSGRKKFWMPRCG